MNRDMHLLDHAGGQELRQIWEGPYRIIYLVAGDRVEIVTILRGSRLPESD